MVNFLFHALAPWKNSWFHPDETTMIHLVSSLLSANEEWHIIGIHIINITCFLWSRNKIKVVGYI